MSRSVFTWKGAVFSSESDISKLRVNWFFPTNVTINDQARDEESDGNHEVVEISDHERDLDSDLEDIFDDQSLHVHEERYRKTRSKSKVKTENQHNDNVNKANELTISKIGSTNIDLCHYGHNHGNIRIIADGVSFDTLCSIRVPVFLVALTQEKSTLSAKPSSSISSENEQREILLNRCVLLGLSENIILKHTKSFLENYKKNEILQGTNLNNLHEKSFRLLPLRTFLLNDDLLRNTSSITQSFSFVSNYGLLNVNTESAKVSIYFGSLETTEDRPTQTQTEHSLCGKDASENSTILLFEVYNCIENDAFVFIALMSDKDGEQSHSKACEAHYFHTKQPFLKDFKHQHIQLQKFFPKEFSQMLLSFSITSAIISRELFDVLSSSVIIISTTGFAILFQNGEMIHCVRLTYDIGIENSVLQNIDVNIIDIDSNLDHRSAICMNNHCDIVDWPKKTVLLSYSNVSFVSKFDILCNGCPTILLLLFPESGLTSHNDLSVKDLIPLIVDWSKPQSDEDERESPETTKNQSKYEYEDINQECDNVAQDVLENLVSQEKKCKSEFKEMEQCVKDKEIFIENMLQSFSSELSLRNASEKRNMYLQPLVPLIGNSPSKKKEENLASSSPKQILQFGELWKRTVDCLLICGIEVLNISTMWQVSYLNLILVPINPSTTSASCHSKGVCHADASCQTDLPVRKRLCLEDEEAATECNNITLKPKESSSLTAYTNADQILGGEKVIFKVVLTYKLQDTLESDSMKQRIQSVCCGKFCLSSNDFISDAFSIKLSLTAGSNEGKLELTPEDILALNCIQKCHDLEMISTMTSVLALKSALKRSASLSYVAWADQFIIVAADHKLRYCRIKWQNQVSKHKARLRIYTRFQTEVILFVQFLYNLAAKDVIITLPENHDQPSISTVKVACQSLVDKVDDSITFLKKCLSIDGNGTTVSTNNGIEIGTKKTGDSVHSNMTAKQTEIVIERNTLLTGTDEEDIIDELQSPPNSPTFKSSASRRGKVFPTNIVPSMSHNLTGRPDTDTTGRNKLNVFNANARFSHSSTADTSLSVSESSRDSLGKGMKDPVNVSSKVKTGKGMGSKGKGKGKLARKK